MNTNEDKDTDLDKNNGADGGEEKKDVTTEPEKEKVDNEPEPEKVIETPEAKRARLTRQLEQLNKKYPVEEVKKSSKKSEEFGYGEKAFLATNGVKDSDEVDLVKGIMESTGKSLEEVLESKYFQAELKELKDTKLSANALPSSSKRTGQSAQTTVEYWISKGELPPPDQRELRQKVVNARLKQEKSKNIFTDTPVVGKF